MENRAKKGELRVRNRDKTHLERSQIRGIHLFLLLGLLNY